MVRLKPLINQTNNNIPKAGDWQRNLLIDYLDEHGQITEQEAKIKLKINSPISVKYDANKVLARRNPPQKIITKSIKKKGNPFSPNKQSVTVFKYE